MVVYQSFQFIFGDFPHSGDRLNSFARQKNMKNVEVNCTSTHELQFFVSVFPFLSMTRNKSHSCLWLFWRTATRRCKDHFHYPDSCQTEHSTQKVYIKVCSSLRLLLPIRDLGIFLICIAFWINSKEFPIEKFNIFTSVKCEKCY